MRWHDPDFPTTPTEEPVVTIKLMSLERAVLVNFIEKELKRYEQGELEATVWLEDLLRKLLKKLSRKLI